MIENGIASYKYISHSMGMDSLARTSGFKEAPLGLINDTD